MSHHEFGGSWTDEKLECVRKYLAAYRKILAKHPYFTTTYVDAFAGTGRIQRKATARHAETLFDDEVYGDAEGAEYRDGSARIALQVDSPFDRYLLVERSHERTEELGRLRDEFKNRKIDIRRGDANDVLLAWCRDTDWKRNRAVVFLDPYGMQVQWALLEALAGTRAIDLWLLFPLGVAVNRLLTRSSPPPPEWAEPLTRIFGTDK